MSIRGCGIIFVVGLAILAGGRAAAGPGKPQPDWTVLYGTAKGPEGRAVELLTGELGDLILREPGIYATHVLPCHPANGDVSVTGNVFLVGTKTSNRLLASYLDKDDLPEGGYLVRVISEANRDVVVLAGDTPAAVIWAVSDFATDGLVMLRDRLWCRDIFCDREKFRSSRRLLPYESRRKPQTHVRSLFTWAHPIDDFREYFRNMARLKLNRIYLWNDYPPLNAAEVVAWAHSWGIEVFWGFPWGWDTSGRICENAGKDVEVLKLRTLADWRKNWRDLPGDGIYFQTFTETAPGKVGGESIARRAVRLANAVAADMLAEKPQLRIVFGLHATSVRDDLIEIAQTDSRMEILWEDTPGFPYTLSHPVDPEKDRELVESIISDLAHPVGIVWKCQLLQDWNYWNHQAGPYVMGVTSRRTYEADKRLHDGLWENYRSDWTLRAYEAYAAARLVHAKGPHVELNGAVQFNGPIRFPTALMAELFYSTEEPLEKIMKRVLLRTRQ